MSTAAPAAAKKMIHLRSSDKKDFEVEEAVALQSQTIKNMIDAGLGKDAIPLPNVPSDLLTKVIEYCTKHLQPPAGEGSSSSSSGSGDKLKAWDAEFVNLDFSTLFSLIMAANFMEIEGLLDLATQAVADRIVDMGPDDVRKLFNIHNDFTPEEEEALRKENAWTYQ